MKSIKILLLLLFITHFNQAHSVRLVASRKVLAKISQQSDNLLVASPGRSGSSMLTDLMIQYATDFNVIKTHLLPPEKNLKGKILFIFSNPDFAAESALHLTLKSKSFGFAHFHNNLDSADHAWLKTIGDTENQTLEKNLLSYDGLGCHKQLTQWLHARTRPCSAKDAQILAIKFENLWDLETIEALKKFLNLKDLVLPVKRERGYHEEALSSAEAEFRKTYNLGTPEHPIYAAYDNARALWQKAPAFQFLRISPKGANHILDKRKHRKPVRKLKYNAKGPRSEEDAKRKLLI